MSEALCQCGHTEDLHHRWQDDPVNCYGLIGGNGDLPCGCRKFIRTSEQIEARALIDHLAACKHLRQMVVTKGPWRRWVCPDCKIEQDHPFTPPPTREPIRLTDEEREPACPACGHALDSPDGCSECPAPTLTDEAEAAWLKWVYENADLFNTDRLSFLAGFRAARLAGGPTLADAWDEGWAAYRDWMNDGDDLPDSLRDKVSPYRTPESEDTDV